ncbi:hypothetical protein P8452_63729 [Trifolium repens]|nr:hypothetical protein P8452_63729 [Trifolium repens]
MALQTATPPTTPSAEMVGNAFVEQYYHILHQSPELVYRFYQESSVISRPDSNGVMTSVTTMKGINEKILSLNFKEFKAEIKTADAQKSHKEGITVLVTGCLTGKDNLRRKFAQSFFLAPQDNGFFVLNDVFRYVEDREPLEPHPVNGVDDAIAVTVTSEPEPIHISDPSPPDPANSHLKDRQIVAENAYEPSNHHETQIVAENENIVEPDIQSNENDDSQAAEITSSQEDAPKKSYASIVKVPKGKLASAKVYVPTNTVKKVANRTESQVVESVVSAAVPEAAQDSIGNPESNDSIEEVEGHSIYIRNLPLNVTVAQLETEFKKFGPIKPGGIQVRNNKQQGYCFGFVEYLSLNSMNNAVQASPIAIGGRQAVIEIKRTTARVGSGAGGGIGRARTPSGRPGFRNDSFRGRGNFGGGRGYGRNNDHGNRGEFSIRGRGPGGHGESYHQGRGRGGGRSNAFKQSAVPTE